MLRGVAGHDAAHHISEPLRVLPAIQIVPGELQGSPRLAEWEV